MDVKSLLPSEPMLLDETIHVHHCKQGRNNDRFYITRKQDGYVYYCHHCGASGFSPASGMAPTKSLKRISPTVREEPSDQLYVKNQVVSAMVAHMIKELGLLEQSDGSEDSPTLN
jgi:hypothetical protein